MTSINLNAGTSLVLNSEVQSTSPAWRISFRYRSLSGLNSKINIIYKMSDRFFISLDVGSTSDFFGRDEIRLRIAPNNWSLNAPNGEKVLDDGKYHDIDVYSDGTNLSCDIDGVTIETRADFDGAPLSGWDSLHRESTWDLLEYIEFYESADKSNLVHSWYASDSDTSDTGLQPVLIDSVAGNNATGVEYPTDGTAFVEPIEYGLRKDTTVTPDNLSATLTIPSPTADGTDYSYSHEFVMQRFEESGVFIGTDNANRISFDGGGSLTITSNGDQSNSLNVLDATYDLSEKTKFEIVTEFNTDVQERRIYANDVLQDTATITQAQAEFVELTTLFLFSDATNNAAQFDYIKFVDNNNEASNRWYLNTSGTGTSWIDISGNNSHATINNPAADDSHWVSLAPEIIEPVNVTTTDTLLPPSDLQAVTLANWAGDAAFPITPAAGMQLVGSDLLTITDDGTVTGPDGSYNLTLIDPDADGTAYTENYVIGVVPEDVVADTTLSAPVGHSFVIVNDRADYTVFDDNGYTTEQRPQPGEVFVYATANNTVFYDNLTFDTDAETGSIYFCIIRADGAADAAEFTNLTSVQEAAPQGTITIGTITAGDTTASIPFTYNNTDQTGFEYSIDGGTTWLTAVSPISLTGLTNDQAYTIQIRAVNAGGTSAEANDTFTPTASAVTAPPAGTVTIGTITAGDTVATVPFTYSDTDQTGFEYSIDSGVTWLAATSPIELTGLTNDQAYTIQVRAVNADGTSTEASDTFTPTATVTDPIDVTTTATLQRPAGWQTIILPEGYDNYIFTHAEGTQFEFETTDKTGWQFGIEADPAEVELVLSGTDIELRITGVDDGTGTLVRPTGIDILNAVLIDPAMDGTAHGCDISTTEISLYEESAAAPAGTITFGTISVTANSATIPFSYSDSDADSFEYQLATSGTWITATSPIELSGLSADTMYGIDIRPVNSVGTGTVASDTFTTAEIEAMPPAGTVTIGTISVTETTATIPFSYSETDQDSFEYQLDNSGNWITATSPIELTGLADGTSYNIEIRAVNADGTSAAASDTFVTDVVEVILNPPAGTVTIGTITVGETSATIPFSYNMSDQDGIEYELNGSDNWITATSPIELSGLNNNTNYSIAIRAFNADGTSNTATASFTTDETIVVAPPAGTVSIGVINTTDTTATVPFSYSMSDQTGFEYELGNNPGNWYTAVSPIELTGLNSETNYEIRIRAVNNDGVSSSAVQMFTTMDEVTELVGIGPGRNNVVSPGQTFDVTVTVPEVTVSQSLVAYILHQGTKYTVAINSVDAESVNVTAPQNAPLFAATEGKLVLEIREFNS